MTFQFRPAVRSNVSLILGLAGASGSGKTFSAFRLAAGIAGGKRFAVIDTESGRASHYADRFAFDVAELREPFTPHAYAEAIAAADKAEYPVIVVDSTSHEYAGAGGILDMQEAEFQRMGARDAVKMTSWIKPKMEHKKMMQRLLQTRAHLILCFRAEEKIEIVKDEQGRTKIVPKQGPAGFKGWLPVCEKTMPYELTASFLLVADAPGIPHPIKLQEQHRPLFPLDKEITEESGRRIAEWARGGTNNGVAPSPAITSPGDVPTASDSTYINVDQVTELGEMLKEHGLDRESFCAGIKVPSLAMIPADKYAKAKSIILEKIEKRRHTA
jgi:hypothetical protein